MRGRAAGRRAAVLDRALRKREGNAEHDLDARRSEHGITATLYAPNGKELLVASLTPAPLPEELAPILAALRPRAETIVRLRGDVDHTTEYRLMRLLSDLGIPEVRAGGSTLTRR